MECVYLTIFYHPYFIIFISYLDEASEFHSRILTNQKSKLFINLGIQYLF